jgi:flavin-dependent dehydrogenase
VPLGGHVELHTIPHGYCGLVEVADGVSNLCCWVEVGAFRHAGCTPDRFLTSALAHNQPLRSRLRTAERIDRRWITTSVTGRRTATPVEESVWNIGDRVTMVAPLTGDGMGMGLRAAELAATILLMGFRREMPWEEATTEYARRWAREFLPRLRWGRCLEAIMLRPRSASLACLAMKGFPALTHMVYHRTRRIMPTTDSSMFVT